MTSYRNRQEQGTALCRKLAARVATVAPPGLGRWDGAWEIVAAPSADYLVALSSWEATGSDAAEERLRASYTALVRAWKLAADQYRDRRAPR